MQTNLLLDIAAEACGDRIAIGSKTAGLSYAVLRTRARAVGAAAAGLVGGVGGGAVVGGAGGGETTKLERTGDA